MKQKCIIEFLHAEIIAPTDINSCLLNIYGDQTVDVSTVRWWVVHFSSGDSDSGSPPLVQMVTSTACRLTFVAVENAYLVVLSV
ncbi:hypothetical protein, partial [Klebsiella pneumoniae]|uniref:hypothetical protein n=1 Tax=Klebsiella pneumoniae TaxID=573 RepID=UPI003A8405B2